MTPLHWAVHLKQYDCAKALVQLGATISAKTTKSKKTALEMAMEIESKVDRPKFVNLLRWFGIYLLSFFVTFYLENGEQFLKWVSENNIMKVREMLDLDEIRQLIYDDSVRMEHQNTQDMMEEIK